MKKIVTTLVSVLSILIICNNCSTGSSSIETKNNVSISFAGDSVLFESIMCYKINPTSGYQVTRDSSILLDDGMNWEFHIDEPCLINFYSHIDDRNLQGPTVFVTPGDTVFYKFKYSGNDINLYSDYPEKYYTLIFTGDNQDNYNFLCGDTSATNTTDAFKLYYKTDSTNQQIVKHIYAGEKYDTPIFHPLSQAYYQALKKLNASCQVVIPNISMPTDTLITEFTDDVLLNTKLLKYPSCDTITLGFLLNNLPQTTTYFDIWASSCRPCRAAIRSSKDMVQRLKKEHITVVYISIDADINLWKSTSEYEGIEEYQYLLIGGWDSPLSKAINLRTIPRYFILDKNHNIITLDAPRLTDENTENIVNVLTSAGILSELEK